MVDLMDEMKVVQWVASKDAYWAVMKELQMVGRKAPMKVELLGVLKAANLVVWKDVLTAVMKVAKLVES